MDLHPGQSRRGFVSDQAAPPLSETERREFELLQQRIHFRFQNRALLQEAMTHSSWSNEAHRGGRDNERLEYLGDAVLELVSAEYLFLRFPNYDEGKLTRIRSSLVNTSSLARCAERLDLGRSLLLGKGAEKIGARKTPSLLANVFEALIGAIFLDAGFQAAAKLFLEIGGDVESIEDENFKGHLQEKVQELYGIAPTYRVTAHRTKHNIHEYLAEVLQHSEVLGSGTGTSKQSAEQNAARDALEKLIGTASRSHHAPAGGEPKAAKPRQRKPRRGGKRTNVPVTDDILTPPPLAGLRRAVSRILGRGRQQTQTPPQPGSRTPKPGGGQGGGRQPKMKE